MNIKNYFLIQSSHNASIAGLAGLLFLGMADSALAERQIDEELFPGQAAGQANSAFSQSSSQTSNMSNRMFELRKHLRDDEKDTKLSALTPALSSLGSGAGDTYEAGGLLDDRLGVYVNGEFSKGQRINTGRELGYDADNAGLTIGADYRLTDQFLMGAAFGYADDKSQFKLNRGQLLNRGYSGSIYGSYSVTDNFFVDGIFTYTHNDYDSERRLKFPSAGKYVLGSSYSDHQGDQQRLSAGAGYQWPMGPWTLGLNARSEYGRVNIDPYAESGETPYNLRFDKQFQQSVLSSLGWQVNYVYSTPWAVLQPQLNLDWWHEFMNNSRTILAYKANGPAYPGKIRTNDPDRDYLTLRAGVSAVFAHGLSSFMQYETLLENRYDTLHTARVGVRWDF